MDTLLARIHAPTSRDQCQSSYSDPTEMQRRYPRPGLYDRASGYCEGGTIRWREKGYYVLSPLGTPLWIGKADVKGPLGITGGTVYGVPVEKGSGKFKGTLDHSPLILPPDPITGLRQPPTFVGTLRLKFLDVRDRDDLDTADDGKGRCPKCHSHQRQRDDLDTADEGNGVDDD